MKSFPFLMCLVFSIQLSAQNIGINNLDPTNSLDINGSMRLRPIELDATSNLVSINSTMGHIILVGTPTGTISINDVTSSANGTIVIIDNQTSFPGILEDYRILQGTRRIFISHNEVYAPLDGMDWRVSGNSITDPMFDFIGTITNTPLAFRTNSTEKMRLSTGGTLGIGTPNPNGAFKLDVNGGISSAGLRTIGPNNSLIFHDQTRPTREFRWLGNGGYARFKFVPNPTDVIVVDSTNRIGFGGSNPTTNFEVSYAVGGQLARFNGGNDMWITLAENGANRGYLGSYSGNAEDIELGTYGGNSTGKVHLTTGNQPRLSVDNNGNVGIGTLPSAGHRLTVQGGDMVIRETGAPAVLQMDSDFSSTIEFFKNTTSEFFIAANDVSLRISRSGLYLNQDFSIDQEGTVGISTGLYDPVSKLNVMGGTDASYTLHGYIMTGATDGANLVIDNNEILARSNGMESDLFIQHDGGHLLLCGNEEGGVGIGLLNGASMPAGSLLAVDGKITCEEVLVKLSQNWPDYVFEKEYPLRELSEVKSFIEVNKHLPGIPNANEIEQSGLALGEIQRKMMEKIEELTLYVIQLQEEIELLKKK